MAQLTDFFINAQLNDDCNIVVADNTIYPYQTEDRENIGIALFYDISNFVNPSITGADFSNPNQSGIQGEWVIEPVNGNVNYIRAFVIPLYIKQAYAPNSVVMFGGQFYYTLTGALITESPTTSTAWVLISISTQVDIDAAYAIMVAADGISSIYGYADTNINVNCDYFIVTKDSCYNYTITDNTGDGTIKTIKIYTYATGTLLTTITIDPSISTTVSVDLTEYGDNVFKVLVSYGGISAHAFQYLIIYEYCSLWNCYQEIFKALTCGEYNPCCTTCDKETLIKNDKYREALNIMTGFMFSIYAYISIERINYLGIFSIDETRATYLSRVADYIEKAKLLMVECGFCSDIADGSDTPCTTCN